MIKSVPQVVFEAPKKLLAAHFLSYWARGRGNDEGGRATRERPIRRRLDEGECQRGMRLEEGGGRRCRRCLRQRQKASKARGAVRAEERRGRKSLKDEADDARGRKRDEAGEAGRVSRKEVGKAKRSKARWVEVRRRCTSASRELAHLRRNPRCGVRRRDVCARCALDKNLITLA